MSQKKKTSPQPVQLQLKLDQTVEASQLLERGFNLLRTMLHQV